MKNTVDQHQFLCERLSVPQFHSYACHATSRKGYWHHSLGGWPKSKVCEEGRSSPCGISPSCHIFLCTCRTMWISLIVVHCFLHSRKFNSNRNTIWCCIFIRIHIIFFFGNTVVCYSVSKLGIIFVEGSMSKTRVASNNSTVQVDELHEVLPNANAIGSFCERRIFYETNFWRKSFEIEHETNT